MIVPKGSFMKNKDQTKKEKIKIAEKEVHDTQQKCREMGIDVTWIVTGKSSKGP